MNYDPNLVSCGRRATQTVRLTFQRWGYTHTATVNVGGNCTGMTVMDCAIGMVFDNLDEVRGESFIVMTNESGEELEVSDDDLKYRRWLEGMLVGAEILDIQPETPSHAGN